MKTSDRGPVTRSRNSAVRPRVVALAVAMFAVSACGLIDAPTPPPDNGAVPTEAATPGSSPAVSLPADANPGEYAFNDPSGSPVVAAPVSVDQPFVDPSVDQAALDADLQQIEDAFASKDPAKVAEWLHPDVRERLTKTFTAKAEQLDQVAVLLATRRPVFVGADYAEYEITDNGATYSAIYQRSGDHWMLVGL
jgi:hypothetical protein